MNDKDKRARPTVSLSSYIEQLAAFLRKQAKPLLSTKQTFLKNIPALRSTSAGNAIEQIAKLLRDEVHKSAKPKKRKRRILKKIAVKKSKKKK